MATDKLHDLLSDKIGTAVELALGVDRDVQTDFPDWPDMLHQLYLLAETVGSATRTAVEAARHDGVPWEKVGRAMGDVTKQAAQQRFAGAAAPRLQVSGGEGVSPTSSNPLPRIGTTKAAPRDREAERGASVRGSCYADAANGTARLFVGRFRR